MLRYLRYLLIIHAQYQPVGVIALDNNRSVQILSVSQACRQSDEIGSIQLEILDSLRADEMFVGDLGKL